MKSCPSEYFPQSSGLGTCRAGRPHPARHSVLRHPLAYVLRPSYQRLELVLQRRAKSRRILLDLSEDAAQLLLQYIGDAALDEGEEGRKMDGRGEARRQAVWESRRAGG